MGNSIEETIKIIERKIKEAEHYSDITGLYLTLDEKLCNAFINILSDYKRVLKENEELKEYLITQNCEINRLNLDKIRLELSQLPDTTEQYKYLKNEYKMRLERTDLENYKSNYISIQTIKDKIKELKQEDREWTEELSEPSSNFKNIDMNLKRIKNQINVLQELLGGKEQNE